MFWNYSQPPLWLQNNKLFQLFFLLRKIYFTKSKFKHFSQFAEDVSITRLFPRNYKGFFVDVGCFHPVKYNNTWQFYKRGWSGVNVDIDSIKIKAFDIARPRDYNISCAISSECGEVEYYSNGFYSLTTTTSSDFSNLRRNYQKKVSKCARLDDVLKDSPYSERQIDFLTIDAEGSDYQVLKSLNFEKYKPIVVAIETHQVFFKDVEKTKEFLFLKSLDYDLIAWCGLTIVFGNKRFSNKKILNFES